MLRIHRRRLQSERQAHRAVRQLIDPPRHARRALAQFHERSRREDRIGRTAGPFELGLVLVRDRITDEVTPATLQTSRHALWMVPVSSLLIFAALGLLLTAARDLRISLPESWMIGDILNDVEAGNRAGCKTVLIDNGNETEWEMNDSRQPTFKASNLLEAASFIVQYEKYETTKSPVL